MIPFPNKKYSVIYADPLWSYQDKRCLGKRSIREYYILCQKEENLKS